MHGQGRRDNGRTRTAGRWQGWRRGWREPRVRSHSLPHHTRLGPTLLLARALRWEKYPLSNKICEKQPRQQIYLTPTPVSFISREPPTPFF